MTVERVKHESLEAALAAAQADFEVISKDTENPFFKSKYADLPAILRSATPVLAKHGLGVTQAPSFEVIGDKAVDTLITTIFHESGQTSTSQMILRPVKTDPQSQGAAITYARRYAYMAVLGLVADVDDDGNSVSRSKRSTTAKPKSDDQVFGESPQNLIAAIGRHAQKAGATRDEVAAYFAVKYEEPFVGTRNIEALKETAIYYKAQAEKAA